MNIKAKNNLDTTAELLVLGLWDDDTDLYNSINPTLSEDIRQSIDSKILERGFGNVFSTKLKDSLYKDILIITLGDKKDMNTERIRRVMSRIVSYLRKNKYKSFTTNITSLVSNKKSIDIVSLGRSCAEGLCLSDYSFDKYKSKKEERSEIIASFQIEDASNFMRGVKEGIIISESTNYAKDLVNEPSRIVTPEYIEGEALKLANKNTKIRVLNRKEMEKLGLNLILAVSSGSDKPAKLIIIEYNNGGKDKYTAIVGKGITFDSGGYDIKPAGQFADMKCDMSGAAAVLGTIKAAQKLELKKNILGVIPACENLINGSAYKPGDIIRAYNGKTVEIANTDAEGRLILADAIAYTEKNYSPDTIIDLATLTGACVIALGYYASGLISNSPELVRKLSKSGNDSYDRVWELPFFEEYQDNMDGDISDLKNMSVKGKGREAGAITGAVFISKFVDLEKTKWAHLDIAGTAFLPESREYNQKYASGAGVRLLTYYLMGN
ncbi:MAG: putative cytosol aminopeptidase [Candidatus Woesearchaeota archaeon]|nr:MAG: putative cytosol aminopeptidase [Candidatus Woesearchaeota archaeon]